MQSSFSASRAGKTAVSTSGDKTARHEPASGYKSAGSGTSRSRPAAAQDQSSRPERTYQSERPARDDRSSRGDRPFQSHSRPVQGSPQRGGGTRPAPVKNGRGGRVKQFIDPSRFICDAKHIEQEAYVPENRFEDFKVQKRIIANLLAKGYVTPTPIQDKTIKLVLEGKDVVGIANTGTGKTAAFAVPLINDLITHMDNRMLVMAPTRELAQQIVEEMVSFSKGCNLKIALVIGGASMNLQQKALRAGPRIVVGTPGRIKDHLGQGTLNLSGFNRIVLDEVDRMLDMGFIKDITSILSRANPDRQSLFFSATMESEIEKLIGRFSRDPVTVSTRVGATADSVSQNVVWFSTPAEKIEKLHDILIDQPCSKVIIFDDTKRSVEKLAKELDARGFKVDRIHGNKSQAQRSRAITRLKSGEVTILVATDVAARGLDVSDVSHVINYSQPNTYDDYVHRIGRTGRAGKVGQALTFLQK